MGARIGADVGGTFTDIVLETPDGELRSAKVLTDHHHPEAPILAGVADLAAGAGVDFAGIDQFIHGTTLATNALIERRGARTALVTTAGFRDVIETRTEGRYEQYDLNIVLPPPLIERKDRLVVPERLNARGEVLLPLDEAAAADVIDRIEQQGYESVAVGFLHSYRNAEHERRFRDLLLARLPGIAVSLSAEVAPQMRELERFNTVCANAYVQPKMAAYLMRLRDRLAELGSTCPLYLIHSGGGLIGVETAARFPVRLVESGPAGGAIFAADLAARHGLDRVVSYDMGGTTAKIALIENYVPQTAKTFEVDRSARFKKGSGMRISIPVIEMIEIGAGGGSIAHVDTLRQIRVGPHSAGSDPGPAAYGLGGTRPTVTDANIELGRIAPETFGAPNIDLDPAASTAALGEHVGTALAIDPAEAAVGIAEVVDENMANAARVHAVENGKDLRGFSMVAFGGAGPLHASRLMDKLGIDQLLVPPDAGVGSAVGFLRAPFAYEAIRSFYSSTERFDFVEANRVLDELVAEATQFVTEGTSGADGASPELTVDRQVAMRYAGQGWEIPVRLPPGRFDEFASDLLVAEFTKAYEEFFGRAIDDVAIEAVSWSVRVATVEDPPARLEAPEPAGVADSSRARSVYDPTIAGFVDCAIIERADLVPGVESVGPAIIVEPQTSTVIGSGHRAIAQLDGSLMVTRAADGGRS